MSHFKAPDNSLHYLDNDAFVSLLPAGSVPITDDEAAGMRAAQAPIVPPPTTVSMRQARIALHRAGLLAAVNAAVAADPEASITWEFSNTVERSMPMVATFSAALGLTEQQLDDLFTTAATL